MNKIEKILLLVALLIIGYCQIDKSDVSVKNVATLVKSKPAKVETLPHVRLIPDQRNNYRSKQLTTDQLEELLAKGVIKKVIRMNGDGEDAAGVPIAKEREICERYKVDFQYVNAHGKQAKEEIRSALLSGNTLLHCKHGFDRTGGMVGNHLKQLGFDTLEIIEHNNWKDYLAKKGKAYEVYYKMIL